MAVRPFHFAFLVHDLASSREFYGKLLGCAEGRSDSSWVDFDLFGHQIVTHLDVNMKPYEMRNPVDGEQVPVPHFGVVLTMEQWRAFSDRLVASGIEFVIRPTVRFAGLAGEQATMFFRDPSGNALEFKAFADDTMLFATD